MKLRGSPVVATLGLTVLLCLTWAVLAQGATLTPSIASQRPGEPDPVSALLTGPTALDAAFTGLSAGGPWRLAASVPSWTSYEDDDPAITYSPAEAWLSYPRGSDGHLHYASAAGATAEFTFTGTAIKGQTLFGPNCGIVSITIDDFPPLTMDLYRDRPLFLVIEKDGLASRQHVLRIEVTGDKNAASRGTVVVLDWLAVMQ